MKTILVIDDERDVLDIVRSVLKTKGYNVLCAAGGEEGLRTAEREGVDLIVCDLMMPKVSGLEVIKRLKKHETLCTIPIVVLSAVSADRDKPPEFWAKGLGVDEFIEKPFDPLDLLGRVEALLRRSLYVSARAGAGNTPLPVRNRVDLKAAEPEDVARAYVEAWNSRDWETEYNCLGEEMTSSYKREDYLLARERAWQEDTGANRVQSLAGVLESKITGLIAKIVAERKETFNGRVWMKKNTFTFKKTNNGWKIVRFREEPLTRTETQFE